jgi:hypothetical protein
VNAALATELIFVGAALLLVGVRVVLERFVIPYLGRKVREEQVPTTRVYGRFSVSVTGPPRYRRRVLAKLDELERRHG